MIFFLSLAFAQETVFEPQVADLKLEGKTYSGILVDERTFLELGELRVLKQVQEAKLGAYQDWETWYRAHSQATIEEMRVSCELGYQDLMVHYETALKQEQKSSFLQKQGFTFGVALGLVGATGIFLGATHLYGQAMAK